MSRELLIPLPFDPTPRQLEAARACLDPEVRVISFDGAYRSGKTQGAARVLFEWATGQPAQYLVGRATYRALKDSTQRALLHGDGGLPPLISPEMVKQYRASDETVVLRNGAEILFRSLEADQTEKLRGLTLGGALIDQVEELDGGPAGERIWDTVLGRLSDPRGPRKLIAISNPAGLTHWLYRRVVNPATRDRRVAHVHFRMTDNPHLPVDYVAAMMETKETRPHWFRSFVEGSWGAFEGMAYEEFDLAVHVVRPFVIPEAWERFESLDHGASNPTAALAWAVDHDGNVVVFDSYYAPGLVSEHAPAILERRARGVVVAQGVRNAWQRDGETNANWSDPSMWANHGHVNRWGQPASIATEYQERGISLVRANNDRAAGYMRLLELVHVDAERVTPPWAKTPGVKGAPRFYIFEHCDQGIAQLQSAPIAADGVNAGECVDPKWESAHGHFHAALRYGALSRPGPSPRPPVVPETPAEMRAAGLAEWLAEREARWDDPDTDYDELSGRFAPV